MHGKRNCARMEFQGTFNSTPGANATPAGISMSITGGDITGVSWFDPELGITIDTIMNENMNLVMTMPVNPRGTPGLPPAGCKPSRIR